jgi:galactose mutarotase-like enzyme
MISCDFDLIDMAGRTGAMLIWMKDDTRGIRVGIAPADGGGIASFQIRRKGSYRDLLYRGLDYTPKPPDGWEGRAPLLWPAVGRSYTPEQVARRKETGQAPEDCQWTSGDQTYPMPIHGFARNLSWTLGNAGHDKKTVWVDCSFKSNRHVAAMYPYHYALTVNHLLKDGELVVTYEVTAGDNKAPMPFSIGNHVSFNMPMLGRGQFEECAIRTPGRKIIRMNELCVPSGETEAINLAEPARLDKPELLDNLLGGYGPGENWLEVIDPSGLRMHIHQEEKSPHGPFAAQEDYLFVFWGVKELGYYCPEPWIGLPNSLNTGKGLILLPPGERFVWEVIFRPEFA